MVLLVFKFIFTKRSSPSCKDIICQVSFLIETSGSKKVSVTLKITVMSVTVLDFSRKYMDVQMIYFMFDVVNGIQCKLNRQLSRY